LEIPIPPLSEQQKIVSEIEEIEAEMEAARKIVEEMVAKKEEVLRKWL
jgi:type I restriction enzyme M protein